MRLQTTLMVAIAGLLLSLAIWWATGGKFAFFFLPILLGLPMLGRNRR